MAAVKWIAIWGFVAITSSIAGGILAGLRNRDHSSWAAWCFVFPPALFLLAFLPTYKGVRVQRRDPDNDDHDLP